MQFKKPVQGSILLKFISDQGVKCELNLLCVLFVPGLNTRLFSIPDFTRDSKFSVHFIQNSIQLCFGDGQTYRIPTPNIKNLPNSEFVLSKTYI